jgi:hypothetical protein
MKRWRSSSLGQLFWLILGLTLLVYVLRGIGILSFIPGGVILLLLALSLILGIAYGLQKTNIY